MSEFSVIIPAYNEANVIRRCLDVLTENKTKFPEIVVACNGCLDNTAELASAYAPQIKVLNFAEGSKTLAINEGLKAVATYPCFVIDADIAVTYESLAVCADHLRGGYALACAPHGRIDLSQADFWVRQYYKIWCQLPYFRDGLLGSGVYGLSAKGIERVGELPKLIADDAYVRRLFKPEERRPPPFDARRDVPVFTIYPATNIKDLMAIEVRRRIGDYQLTYDHNLPAAPEGKGGLGKLARNPSNWLALAVYMAVKTYAKMRGKMASRQAIQWTRDDSSRTQLN